MNSPWNFITAINCRICCWPLNIGYKLWPVWCIRHANAKKYGRRTHPTRHLISQEEDLVYCCAGFGNKKYNSHDLVITSSVRTCMLYVWLTAAQDLIFKLNDTI